MTHARVPFFLVLFLHPSSLFLFFPVEGSIHHSRRRWLQKGPGPFMKNAWDSLLEHILSSHLPGMPKQRGSAIQTLGGSLPAAGNTLEFWGHAFSEMGHRRELCLPLAQLDVEVVRWVWLLPPWPRDTVHRGGGRCLLALGGGRRPSPTCACPSLLMVVSLDVGGCGWRRVVVCGGDASGAASQRLGLRRLLG